MRRKLNRIIVDTVKANNLQIVKDGLMTVEEIHSLSEKRLCPHFEKVNCITKEKTFLFYEHEVDVWFYEQYLNYYGFDTEGDPFKINLIHFDRDENSVKSKPPDELCAVDNLWQLPDLFISPLCGIYFLCLNDALQYVGQSLDIPTRIAAHRKNAVIPFNRVFYILSSKASLDNLETDMIHHLNPPFNTVRYKNRVA